MPVLSCITPSEIDMGFSALDYAIVGVYLVA